MNQTRDRTVLAEWSMVGGTQSKVTDKTNDGLDEGPPRGRVHQPHDGRQATLQPHSVLRHLTFRMPGKYVIIL